MSTLLRRLRTAYHNCVLHPIAGLLWFAGLQAAGDWVHGEPKPRWWAVELSPDGPQLVPYYTTANAVDRLQAVAGRPAVAYVHAADEATAYRSALRLVLAHLANTP